VSATELVELERRRCEAIGAGDADALRQLLSPDYVHIHANGRTEDYGEFFARVGADAFRQTERDDLSVRFYGPVAVMRGRHVTTLRRSADAPLLRVTGIATQVWVHEDGRWLLVSFQVTPTEPTTEVEEAGSAQT